MYLTIWSSPGFVVVPFRQVSAVTPFADIVDVRLPEASKSIDVDDLVDLGWPPDWMGIFYMV
jgi:hypothetical protein